eukprot:3356763-Alexandrium_andersonii.AAC.1
MADCRPPACGAAAGSAPSGLPDGALGGRALCRSASVDGLQGRQLRATCPCAPLLADWDCLRL